MSLTEKNHTEVTHRQLDDELQFVAQHGKPLSTWSRREVLFNILCDSADLFILQQKKMLFFLPSTLPPLTVFKEKFGAQLFMYLKMPVINNMS